MTYTIAKSSEGFYTLVITRENGTRNDYRFKNKAQIGRWLKQTGIK